MKNFFWTTIFWFILFSGFVGYIKWINLDLWTKLVSYIVKETPCIQQECPTISTNLSGEVNTWNIVPTKPTISTSDIDLKFDDIKKELKNINEKLDIQNSNAPDAVTVSLRTTKKTNIRIFPFDGSEYKKYVMPASDDILKDTLNILFDNSAFTLKNTKLDNEWTLTINIEKVTGKSFGWSAAVEQIKTSIEKTATQFSQINNVIILPEDVLQP